METYINSRGCLGRLLGMPWRPAASEVIVALDTEITETQRFLRETTVRPGRRSIDHTLARYLWFGAQTAEVISLACKAGHPAGTATLRRFLFETLLDIHLLVSSKSPALDAARSMAWGVLDWGRVWERHDEAAAEHPHLDARRAPAQSADEAFDLLRAELASLGEDLDLLDQAIQEAREAPKGQSLARLKNAYDNGVPLTYSTDADYYVPGMTRGEVAIEFIRTWQDAGIPDVDILRAMTVTGYKVSETEDERGPIKVGLAADLIAVTGNPLEDIDTLRDVRFVMKDGVVFKKDGVMTPEDFFHGGPVHGWRIR